MVMVTTARHGGMRVYRLLIVTKDARAEEMVTSMEGFEAMGYKPPRLRHTVDEAIECMHKHHIDAIAVDEDPAFAPLMDYLKKQHTTLPIFQIAGSAEQQRLILKEVHQLLSQLHSDDSNDDYDEAYQFNLVRERWMRKLISGMEATKENILSHLTLYRCMESPLAPCLFARLSVPSGDSFLADRWHYGSERLEMALRNFFGDEHDRMTLHIAVVSPEEVRVLACPKPEYTDHEDFTAEKLLGYIDETIEQIEHYLGLSMSIIDIRAMENLAAFAAEKR